MVCKKQNKKKTTCPEEEAEDCYCDDDNEEETKPRQRMQPVKPKPLKCPTPTEPSTTAQATLSATKSRIDNIRTQFKVFHQIASVPVSLSIVCGSIGRGKSVLVAGYLNYLKKCKKYDEIVIISSTIFTGFWTRNGIKPHQQLESVTMAQLLMLREVQKSKKKPKSILLVMDDCGDGKLDVSYRNREFEALCSTMRHYNVSIILICQNLYMISKKVRSMAHAFLLLDISGHDNVTALYDCVSCGESRKDFLESFYSQTQDNGIIYINATKNSKDEGRSLNFRIDLKSAGVKL